MVGTPIRVWNPPNPYQTEERELLGEPPKAAVEVYAEDAKEILSRNDSPDIGFRWSLNPYRGCFHGCAYCLKGNTPILMADGRTRILADVRVGDEVYGTLRYGDYRRYVRTRVLAHWSTVKPAYRILLEDGTELIASADHRFLTNRGWKYVTGSENGRTRRPHLTRNIELMGTGRFTEFQPASPDYKRGYLAGLIRGDGLLGAYCYDGRRRTKDTQYHFRLALADFEALERARQYLSQFSIVTEECAFQSDHKPMRAIRTHAQRKVERIQELIEWPLALCPDEWSRGFLAGIFDADGSCSHGILRVANTSLRVIDYIQRSLCHFNFNDALDATAGRSVQYVRLTGGLREALRFFHFTDTVIKRKRNIEGYALKSDTPLKVVQIEALGLELPLFDMTTGTGDFIADGIVSHNCYARPTHEYLGFGAGTDFERRIVVKRNAPKLLEKAFKRKSWRGETLAFSGVTDCYQPLEAAWRLTRGCLEVCARFRNPVVIITKSLLIRRDMDVLTPLARQASVGISLSIPFHDETLARKMEPGAPTVRRRFETMRLLADAGLRVGIGVAPVIPGLNEQDIPALLQEAKRCGASSAFYTLLRLPGSVRSVFLKRVAETLPLRASKIENKIRQARGGLLNDSEFGKRFLAQGTCWEAAVEQSWKVWVSRLGLNQEMPPETGGSFRRPSGEADAQLRFGWPQPSR